MPYLLEPALFFYPLPIVVMRTIYKRFGYPMVLSIMNIQTGVIFHIAESAA